MPVGNVMRQLAIHVLPEALGNVFEFQIVKPCAKEQLQRTVAQQAEQDNVQARGQLCPLVRRRSWRHPAQDHPAQCLAHPPTGVKVVLATLAPSAIMDQHAALPHGAVEDLHEIPHSA